MRKILVTDFDCTLTYVHYFHFMNNRAGVFFNTDNWDSHFSTNFGRSLYENTEPFNAGNVNHLVTLFFGSRQRLVNLKIFLSIFKNFGYEIHISSRGVCDDIIDLIKKVGLNEYIDQINSASKKSNNNCIISSKVPYITSLLKDRNVEKVVYIDDDDAEHKILQTLNSPKYMYFGSNIGLYKNQNGLDDNMMNSIIEQAIGQSGGGKKRNKYSSKKCRKGWVINQRTGRCIKVGGPTWNRIHKK